MIQVSVGSIAWEKRDAAGCCWAERNLRSALIRPTGVGTLTILDNGPGDADPAPGQRFLVNNVLLGTYTITETVAPTGYVHRRRSAAGRHRDRGRPERR